QVRRIQPHIPSLAGVAALDPVLNGVVAVLNNYHRSNISNGLGSLTPDTDSVLLLVSSVISHSGFAEPVLEDEYLQALQSEVADLHGQIQDSDLSEPIKTHLLNLLDVLANAIVEVEIGGGAALRSAAEEVLGGAALARYESGPHPLVEAVAVLAVGVASEVSADLAMNALPALRAVMQQLGG
ncbi:MAG TPA: hypothetical protein VI141_03645, partial [Acidimicrobiia bacterium]